MTHNCSVHVRTKYQAIHSLFQFIPLPLPVYISPHDAPDYASRTVASLAATLQYSYIRHTVLIRENWRCLCAPYSAEDTVFTRAATNSLCNRWRRRPKFVDAIILLSCSSSELLNEQTPATTQAFVQDDLNVSTCHGPWMHPENRDVQTKLFVEWLKATEEGSQNCHNLDCRGYSQQ